MEPALGTGDWKTRYAVKSCRPRGAAPDPQHLPGKSGPPRQAATLGPLRRDYLATVKWLQEKLGLESGRRALLLKHMVKFGAISSEGTHITTVIMFPWHPGPVVGCLLSLIFIFFKKKKNALWEPKRNKNAKN